MSLPAVGSSAESPPSTGIAALIARTEHQIAAGRMLSPPDNSAMSSVWTIIELIPIVSTSDLQMIKDIPTRFAAHARSAAKAGRFEEARNFLKLGQAFEIAPPPTSEPASPTSEHLDYETGSPLVRSAALDLSAESPVPLSATAPPAHGSKAARPKRGQTASTRGTRHDQAIQSGSGVLAQGRYSQ
jgi:hypothetical protein